MKKVCLLLMLVTCTFNLFAHKEKWDSNRKNWSPLMRAIYKGHTNKFLKLIEKGEDVNFATEGHRSLTAMDVAIRTDNETALKTLLGTNKITNFKQFFMIACARKSAKNVELLIKYGAIANDTSSNGYSTLMYACSFGYCEVIECLIKNGANVNQSRKSDGMTPLMFAVFNGEPKRVALLLKYGANKYARDLKGQLPIDYVDSIYEYLKVSEATKREIRKLLG